MFSEWATNGILQNYCQAKHLRRLENFFLGRQKESSPQIGRTSRGLSCAPALASGARFWAFRITPECAASESLSRKPEVFWRHPALRMLVTFFA